MNWPSMGKRHAPVSLAVPIPPPKRARVAQNEAPDIVSKACRDLPLESIKMIAEYAAEHRPRFAAFKPAKLIISRLAQAHARPLHA